MSKLAEETQDYAMPASSEELLYTVPTNGESRQFRCYAAEPRQA